MREYKFRGRLLSGAGWSYGDLHRLPTGETCIWFTTTGVPGKRQGVSGQDSVDPKTVGQYTGLNDKKRQPIYEGDIIFSSFISDQKAGPVKWSDIHHAYIIDYPRRKGDSTDQWQQMHGKEHCYEVAGNIYDNPEVLANG